MLSMRLKVHLQGIVNDRSCRQLAGDDASRLAKPGQNQGT